MLFRHFFILVAVVNISLHCYGETITSPTVTNWGVWGEMEKCPEGTFVAGFQLKTEPNQGSFRDDSAGNAIRLYCGDPLDPYTPSILSSEGHLGDWGGNFSCPQGAYINGFALRVEAQTLLDNTATNNARFYCNHQEGFYIEGDGLELGRWRDNGIVTCNSTKGVLCGLQTQVQPDQPGLGDDTSLNNISAECCDLPDITESPTASTTSSDPPTTTEESSEPPTTSEETTELPTSVPSTTQGGTLIPITTPSTETSVTAAPTVSSTTRSSGPTLFPITTPTVSTTTGNVTLIPITTPSLATATDGLSTNPVTTPTSSTTPATSSTTNGVTLIPITTPNSAPSTTPTSPTAPSTTPNSITLNPASTPSASVTTNDFTLNPLPSSQSTKSNELVSSPLQVGLPRQR